MKLFMNALPLVFFPCAAFLNQGCSNIASHEELHAQLKRRDNWTILGKVTNNDYENGEVVAISGDGSRYRTGITQKQNFGLELPGNTNYALFFLPASEKNAENPTLDQKSPVLLQFENNPHAELTSTLRLPEPWFDPFLDLGEIDINKEGAFPTKNPSSRLDFDKDGINDLKDSDDQNDGIADAKQSGQEKTEVCHMDINNQSQTITVDLPDLYDHIEHGDDPWPCHRVHDSSQLLIRAPQKNDEDDAEVMPKNHPPQNLIYNKQIILEEKDINHDSDSADEDQPPSDNL